VSRDRPVTQRKAQSAVAPCTADFPAGAPSGERGSERRTSPVAPRDVHDCTSRPGRPGRSCAFRWRARTRGARYHPQPNFKHPARTRARNAESVTCAANASITIRIQHFGRTSRSVERLRGGVTAVHEWKNPPEPSSRPVPARPSRFAPRSGTGCACPRSAPSAVVADGVRCRAGLR
jgi:hypothetical protein